MFALPADAGAAGAGSPEEIPEPPGFGHHQPRPGADTAGSRHAAGDRHRRFLRPKGAKPGQYAISVNGRFNVTCHLEQANGITLLALNREVIDACIAALKSRQSICASGPLNGAVNGLTPATSKLIVVNAGGAMRLCAR